LFASGRHVASPSGPLRLPLRLSLRLPLRLPLRWPESGHLLSAACFLRRRTRRSVTRVAAIAARTDEVSRAAVRLASVALLRCGMPSSVRRSVAVVTRPRVRCNFRSDARLFSGAGHDRRDPTRSHPSSTRTPVGRKLRKIFSATHCGRRDPPRPADHKTPRASERTRDKCKPPRDSKLFFFLSPLPSRYSNSP
jgi:hypothetical protein